MIKNLQHYKNFMSNGYLILPEFISSQACDNLINEHYEIINNLKNDKQTVFDTESQQHAKDKYFLDSGNKISLFYEKDAFNDDIKNLSLKNTIHQSVNKIGHALHKYNQVFKNFSNELYSQQINQLLSSLGSKQPYIVQSMYLLKQPKIGNKVDIHQDSTFIHTKPDSCIGLWFALEDATVENGCLWAVPKSHGDNLKQRFVRNGDSTTMQIIDNSTYDLTNAIALEVKKGTLIVLHGHLAHYSNYNHSDKSRHAYTLHVIDRACKYLDDNWLKLC